MIRNSRFSLVRPSLTLLALCSFALSANAGPFGSKETAATVKIERGGPLKGKSTLALGAFRVAFVTEDAANSESHGMFSGGGSAARMTSQLVGIDHALMQKITDEIYADFLKQAAAKGYTVIDSASLAKSSSAYGALPPMENFDEGRLGTFVIPTGQRSVELAADHSAKQDKGAVGFISAMKNVSKSMATAEANKVFPVAAKDTNSTVVGVTIVVNFANFKGTSSSFGSSKATIAPGATIDGQNKEDISHATSIMAWDASTSTAPAGMAMVLLEGEIHSDVSIGEFGSHSAMKAGDHISNGIAALGAGGQVNKKASELTADPIAYETNVLLVAAQANDMMLSAIAKEK
jgi:hypothetical protein